MGYRYFHQIKVKKCRRFAHCAVCDELDREIRITIDSQQTNEKVKLRKMRHVQYVKQDKSILFHETCCLIIVDEADQLAVGLPHFLTKPKEESWRAVKIVLIGLLHHEKLIDLYLFTVTEEQDRCRPYHWHHAQIYHRYRFRAHLKLRLTTALANIRIDNCFPTWSL